MAKRATREAENALPSIITTLNSSVKLYEKQQKFYEVIRNNTISFCGGPAGSAKTWTAVYSGLKSLLSGEVDKIILTKPIVEAGENLGALPGSVDEKIAPYMESFVLTMYKMIGKQHFEKLVKSEKIEMRPVAYMRGATFNKAFMICDEAQNLSFHQLMTYITRLGDNSKMVIIGDISQFDIKHNQVALPAFVRLVSGIDNIGEFNFTKDDIVRNKILIDIVDRYEQYKETKLLESQNAFDKNKKIVKNGTI